MDYNSLTVVKLKEELKNRGIATTNLKLKKDFVDRLEQHDNDQHTQHNDAADARPVSPPRETSQSPSPQTGPSPSQQPAAPINPDQPASHPNAPGSEQNDTHHDHDAAAPSDHDHETPVARQPAPSDPSQDSKPLVVPSPNQEPAETAPKAASPSIIEDDGKKRKRRSLTPPVSEEVVHKKLKQEADDPIVHLQRDETPVDNQVDMPDAPLEQPDAKIQPMATSDDVLQRSTKEHEKAAPSRTIRSPNERRFKNLINTADPEPATITSEPDDVSVSPALHPATRALYIRDLVRPINPNGLRDHLEDLARPPDHSHSSDSLVQECYVDALRTHAFVLFASISAASRARASIHARIWPPEPMRKPLWADFFPDERLREWIQAEQASGTRPSQAKRWELAYDLVDDGVDVRLVEANPAPHRASIHAGAPNAPSGPRGSMSSQRRPSFPQGEVRRPSQPLAPPPRPHPRAVEEASAPFLELDKLFRFTTTKPKLYWQPVSEDLADDRLDELDRETSRDWDPRLDARRNGDSMGRGLDQLKRYTFEDGDVLVDGGPEFGGGRAFARGGNRGRGRRGADTYRGD